MERIRADYFERDPVVCARGLIGSRFVWDGCEARVIETEAYSATGDEACHTFNRPSSRKFIESHSAGTAYVYLNYGVHWLFNVLVKGPEFSGFVLFRALEPLEGLDQMRSRRGVVSDLRLCAGPGCLTRAFGIGGADHGTFFLESPMRGLFHGNEVAVIADGRVGISRAVDLPWRFSEKHHPGLSRKPKTRG